MKHLDSLSTTLELGQRLRPQTRHPSPGLDSSSPRTKVFLPPFPRDGDAAEGSKSHSIAPPSHGPGGGQLWHDLEGRVHVRRRTGTRGGPTVLPNPRPGTHCPTEDRSSHGRTRVGIGSDDGRHRYTHCRTALFLCFGLFCAKGGRGGFLQIDRETHIGLPDIARHIHTRPRPFLLHNGTAWKSRVTAQLRHNYERRTVRQGGLGRGMPAGPAVRKQKLGPGLP
ncbi:hypothetical protein LZ30DRAFT_709444 [Colletotrichum cereale]|nr:hypothetical protein LZ30DRAFT_709444 [Colletotrichum cereale]